MRELVTVEQIMFVVKDALFASAQVDASSAQAIKDSIFAISIIPAHRPALFVIRHVLKCQITLGFIDVRWPATLVYSNANFLIYVSSSALSTWKKSMICISAL